MNFCVKTYLVSLKQSLPFFFLPLNWEMSRYSPLSFVIPRSVDPIKRTNPFAISSITMRAYRERQTEKGIASQSHEKGLTNDFKLTLCSSSFYQRLLTPPPRKTRETKIRRGAICLRRVTSDIKGLPQELKARPPSMIIARLLLSRWGEIRTAERGETMLLE